MPTWRLHYETRTSDQTQRFLRDTEALRRDRHITHVTCDQDSRVPFTMHVEATFSSSPDAVSMGVLRAIGAEAVPAISRALGIETHWAPLQVSRLRPRTVEEEEARARVTALATARAEAAQQARSEGPDAYLRELQSRGPAMPLEERVLSNWPVITSPHDDQVDALRLAIGLNAPLTQNPIVGFSRLASDPTFAREYQGTFRSEELPGEIRVNPRAVDRLWDAQAPADPPTTHINPQDFEARRILPRSVPLETAPPSYAVAPAYYPRPIQTAPAPELHHRRSRFDRIDDEDE
jgi:hypothetical protein